MSNRNVPITDIKPDRLYGLNNIVSLRLLPGINSKNTLYSLVSEKSKDENGKLVRVPFKETTYKTIKADNSKLPWLKKPYKILVRGEELIKFRKLNNLI